MSLTALGGSASTPSNGTQRTIDCYSALNSGFGLGTNFSSGAVPAIATVGVINRQSVAGMFPVGANGPDGLSNNVSVNIAHIFFPGTGLNRDQYCAISPLLRYNKPATALADAFAVWEIEAHMVFRLPAGAYAQDAGLILHGNTGITGYAAANDWTNGGGAGNPGQPGIAIMATGADNQLRVLARNTAAGAFSKNIATGIIAQPVGGFANDRIRRLKIRLESATLSDFAKATFFVDDAIAHSDFFTIGGSMPHPADLAAVQWLGAFRPFFRNGGNAASAAVVAYSYLRVSAAPSVAAMIGA